MGSFGQYILMLVPDFFRITLLLVYLAVNESISFKFKKMATVVQITGSDRSTNALTLSSPSIDANGVLLVSRGSNQNPSIVQWTVTGNASDCTISDIKKYDDSADIFSSDPANLGQGNAPNWQGTINKDKNINDEETYYIDWTDADGGTHRFDPRIKINS